MLYRLSTALVAVALVASCTKKKELEYGLNPAETLTVNLNTEPPTLDWSKATDTTSSHVMNNIMEGLVAYDVTTPDLQLRPALATAWEPSEKASVWTFTLRENVTWTDGQPFTAQHVVDGWERLLNPATASAYSYFLYDIKNAKDYNQGKLKDFSKVGVSINDKGQVVVTLDKSKSYFPYLLTHASTYPVRKDVIETHGDRWTEPENIVTLGPFQLKIWEHDKSLVLTRNDNYYGTKPKIKNVLAYMITEKSTAINLFDSKVIDAQDDLPTTELKFLRERPEYKSKNLLGTYYYGMNVKKAPMDNVLVRKAVSHAIDRQQITDLLAGGQIPATSFVPPGMFGYEKGLGIQPDIKKANELLDQAGYKDRSKFPKLILGFNTNEDHQRVAENIQAQLKTNLGIQVELQNQEWKVYLKTVRTDAPHMYRMGWIADYPDPDNFLSLMTSYSENNYTNWGNEEFDTLVESGRSVLDKEKRREIYRRAQQILTQVEAPVVPIYNYVSFYLVSERVKNYPVNQMQRRVYSNVEIKK